MNIETINELVDLMDVEATKWGRTEYDQSQSNGKGIQQQFDDAKEFPAPIFYLVRDHDEANSQVFRMLVAWYNKGGDKTERPHIEDTVE